MGTRNTPTPDPTINRAGAVMNPALSDPLLIKDVLAKRGTAFLVDLIVIAVIELFVGTFVLVFSVLTLGLGWHMFALMPVVPFCYYLVTIVRSGRTPGQAFLGLSLRRIEDLTPPTPLQALIWTLGLTATLSFTCGILLLAALLTEGSRTLHDIVAGVIVVRTDALARAPLGFDIGGGSYRT